MGNKANLTQCSFQKPTGKLSTSTWATRELTTCKSSSTFLPMLSQQLSRSPPGLHPAHQLSASVHPARVDTARVAMATAVEATTRPAPLVATTSHVTLAAVEAVASVETKRFYTSLT